MDVKQEPLDTYCALDLHERVKTELNLGPCFKSEHINGLGESVNSFGNQTTGQFAGDVEIEQEIIKCEVPKIEPGAALPLKHDNENVPMLSTIKKEPENTKDFSEKTNLLASIGDVKQEGGEHLNIKTESELLNLNTHCDLPTLKDEDTECTDYFSQPCSSKQVERHLEPLKTKTLKVVCKKRRLYPCPVCQKNFHSSKSRSKHINRHFSKGCIVCKFCGKFMNIIEFLLHYFIHVVQNRNRNVSQTIIEVSKLERVCINYIKQKSNTKIQLNDKSRNYGPNSNSSCSKLKSFEKPYKCDICPKQFNLKSALCRHLKTHSNKKPFKCDICLKMFKLKIHLNQHVIVHTYEKPFKCDFCFKAFKRKCTLRLHLRLHTNEKPFKCDICSKQFHRKDYLNQHLIIHTNKKPFKCDICSKKFNAKSILNEHLIIHSDKKPFKCDICFKQFNAKSNLTTHLPIHSNNKPFKCDICLKKFKLKIHLNQHVIIHTPEKSFKCDFCFKAFKRKYSLGLHLRLHTDEKRFKCDICSKKFNAKSTLNKHLILHSD